MDDSYFRRLAAGLNVLTESAHRCGEEMKALVVAATQLRNPKRVLVIGADLTNATDIIRAHRLVRQFFEDYPDRPFGRHHFVAYGRDDTVTVWHTAQQVTVHFYHEEKSSG